MRKARSSQVVIYLVLVFIIFTACNFPILKDQKQTTSESGVRQLTLPTQTFLPTYTLLPTYTFMPEPTMSSRCDLFPAGSLSLSVLAIHPEDTSVLVYVEFPDMVIGLEDQYDDGLPWEYSALLGESASVWCKLFEGDVYAGRLYCMLPLPGQYKDTAKPFDLYVNDCESPILSITKLSLVVDKTPATGNGNRGDQPEQTQNTCGPEPPDSPACNPTHEQWCYCMGGYYTCELDTIYIPIRGYCNIY